jgi:ankyrin repeat protein
MKRIHLVWMLAVGITTPLAGDTSLFEAIRVNDERAVASLVGNGVDANSRNQQGATALMQAALHASPRVMKLLLDRGADPNAQNPLGATALMWAAGDPEKVKLLLEYHATVNVRANSGRTALIIASAYAGNLQSIRLVLAKGADPKAVDEAGDGPLGNAAGAADVEMLKELLGVGASVNERSNRGGSLRGLTPLMRAAGANCVECVRLLLAHGSDVNAVSDEAHVVKAGLQEHGRLTPLLMAVQWGNSELIQLLLDKGASLEARDSRGLTALMLAVTNERQDVRSVPLLLDRGATADVQANDNQSALSWARKWGQDTEIVRLLEEHGGRPGDAMPYVPTKLEPKKRTRAEAVARSVALLQASNTIFFQKSGCASCHHQMLSGILVGVARDRGLQVDEKLAQEQLKAAITVQRPVQELTLQRVVQGGVPMTNTLFLVSLAAQKYPPDSLTDALVHDIAGMQRVDGSWFGGGTQRPPIEYSEISETAYAIRALRSYASPGRKAEIDRRIARARDWLMSVVPQHTEERVMQVLGLRWADAKPPREMAEALIQAQRPDGGWAQRADFLSDAYATGEVLYALNQACGIPITHPVFRRGTEYLLGTQYKDGSWYVRSRSVKFQPYFDSSFPFEHDQWISAAGTAWAALALSLTVQPGSAADRRR